VKIALARVSSPVVLTEPEQEELERLARRTRTARRLAFRGKIVLACTTGLTGSAVAKKLRTSNQIVCLWRKRFLGRRVDGLLDEPRPGRPREIEDDQIEDVVVRTLETTPRAATHWSTRQMAEKTGLSHMTISRIWRAFDLQLHRPESFNLSPDPLLVPKVRDIVGLYLDPPDHAVVLCVAEKSQIQALNRTQPVLPMRESVNAGPTTATATAP